MLGKTGELHVCTSDTEYYSSLLKTLFYLCFTSIEFAQRPETDE